MAFNVTDNILQIPFWNMTLVHKYIHKMFAYGMIKAYKTFPMYVHYIFILVNK